MIIRVMSSLPDKASKMAHHIHHFKAISGIFSSFGFFYARLPLRPLVRVKKYTTVLKSIISMLLFTVPEEGLCHRTDVDAAKDVDVRTTSLCLMCHLEYSLSDINNFCLVKDLNELFQTPT